MFPDRSRGRNLNATIPNDLDIPGRAGWVLAGGHSSRMGRNKALIEIDGHPLALMAAEALGKVCETVSLVGDPAVYGKLGLPVVPDRFPGLGPLAGIEAALAATTADWNLIVACDMPSLDVSLFEALFEAAGVINAGGDADCAVPVSPDGPSGETIEPLCAVYHRRCHAAIEAALKAGTRRVTEAISALELHHTHPGGVRYVRVSRSEPFANLNTSEDLRRYRNG